MSVNKKIIETEAVTPLPDFEFNTVTYSGNGTSQSITGVGFQPDLVWIKQRNGTNPHGLWDSTRGAGKLLKSNTTEAESGNAGDLLGSFDSDGFQVNRNYLQYTAFDNTNYGAGTYVAWCWKANGGTTSSNTDGTITSTVQAANGFSIVRYTGTGANATIGHGLSAAPELWIGKQLTGSAINWQVLYSGFSEGDYLTLNTTAAKANSANVTFDPTATTVKFHGNQALNDSGEEYIGYAFHSVAGYSKIGSYTGSGAQGNNQTIGFQADWIMIKNSSNTGGWRIFDSVRGTDKSLRANVSDAEYDDTAEYVSFNSTQFYFDGANNANSDINENGHTYIYMAFKIN